MGCIIFLTIEDNAKRFWIFQRVDNLKFYRINKLKLSQKKREAYCLTSRIWTNKWLLVSYFYTFDEFLLVSLFHNSHYFYLIISQVYLMVMKLFNLVDVDRLRLFFFVFFVFSKFCSKSIYNFSFITNSPN